MKNLGKNDWNQLLQDLAGEILVAFGVGDNLDWLIKNNNTQNKVRFVIDNDPKKQGCSLGDLCSYAEGSERDVIIRGVDETLSRLADLDVVVFICNQRYCNEMLEEVKRYSIGHIYCIHEYQDDVLEIEKDKEKYLKKVEENSGLLNKVTVLVDKYGGHGIQISKTLHEVNDLIEIVWIVSDLKMECPDYVKKISAYNWREVIYHISTSKVFIYDGHSLNVRYKKRENQVFIQTKHWSSVTLKKFWLYEKPVFSDKTIDNIRKLSEDTDYCIVGSQFDKDTMSVGFGYGGKYICAGSCRSDILFQDKRNEICTELGLQSDVKYILYAPTCRRIKSENGLNRCKLGVEIPDFNRIIEACEFRYGGKWEVIIRLHPVLTFVSKDLKINEMVHDFTDFQDGQKIVAVSDLMITDYSSIMFEMLFAKKKVFLFSPDLDDFLLNQREFLIDYKKLPFSIATNQKKLMENIQGIDDKEYDKKCSIFLEKFGVHEDGHASERVATLITDLIEGKVISESDSKYNNSYII